MSPSTTIRTGRFPPDHEGSNPYGALLTEALERRGVEVEYTRDYSPEYLRRNSGRIQVLHFHWPHHDYFHPERRIMEARMREMAASLELARKLGYKIVWTGHNIYPHNRLHRSIDHEFRLVICRLADAIIAHCPVNAQGLKERFGRSQRVFVIPHGHFIDVYRTDFTRGDARRELEVPQDAFVYGFIGGILPYKGIEELISAFERLSTDDSWLLLAGGGSPATFRSGSAAASRGVPESSPGSSTGTCRPRTGTSSCSWRPATWRCSPSGPP